MIAGGMRAQGFVYFAAPVGGGKIKIGWSANPPKRIAGLLLWSPVDLELLASVPGTRADENFLHEMFRAIWWRREWFHPNANLLATIRIISASASLPENLRAPKDWLMKRMPGQGMPGRKKAA